MLVLNSETVQNMLNRGHVIALTNVRGGGELGRRSVVEDHFNCDDAALAAVRACLHHASCGNTLALVNYRKDWVHESCNPLLSGELASCCKGKSAS